MNKLHQSGLLIYTKPLVFEDEVLISDALLLSASFGFDNGTDETDVYEEI